MPAHEAEPTRRRLLQGGAAAAVLAGCATPVPTPSTDPALACRLANRLRWGATDAELDRVRGLGPKGYIDAQLHAAAGRLPAVAQAQIDALGIQQRPPLALWTEIDAARKAGEALPTEDERKAAQAAYQQALNKRAREAASRRLLPALYSPNQLPEQMQWFWFNHFNVHQYKSNIRVLLADYEERALRPHALGRFRDLLGAATRHPAMLRYLDNEQNAVRRINENHARELLELHTLGVDGGYTQHDVQELARVLTGHGVNFTDKAPAEKPEQSTRYLRDGIYEFVPARYDFGSGFLNRLAAELQGHKGKAAAVQGYAGGREAIAFTDQLPLVLRGELSVANLSLKAAPQKGDERLRQRLLAMYRGHPLQAVVAESFEVRDEAARQMAPTGMAGEMEAANRNAINAKGFEAEARRIARLMRDRYALGFVDVGGWDTHVGQGAATGYLASRFEELGCGLAGFADELGEAAWRNTVVVVLSEFGRTMRENGNRGTDHGHGGVHWVLGGGAGGGCAAGHRSRHAEPEPRPAGAQRIPGLDRRPAGAAVCAVASATGPGIPGCHAARAGPVVRIGRARPTMLSVGLGVPPGRRLCFNQSVLLISRSNYP